MLGLLLATAYAGNVYVNNTLVDPASMPNVSFEKVTVRVDAQGNLWIDAPGYRIQVMGGSPGAQPATMGGSPGGVTSPAVVSGSLPGMAPRPGAPPTAGGVSAARWWMVTEDGGTTGHSIEVWINNQLAYTVVSGQPQKIVDVGRFLHIGANQVRISAISANPAGGSYYVYLGTGSDQSGTVVMDNPIVQFGVSAGKSGTTDRQYTLTVDR